MSIIKELNPSEISSVFELLKELRPHLTIEQFQTIYSEARKADQFTFYGYYEGSECIGLMGVRYLHDYVHGFHLYIDDLVVTTKLQSKGIGAKLLAFAEDLARAKSCSGLRLCTGIDNEAGKKFYEREKWNLRAVAYKKKI